MIDCTVFTSFWCSPWNFLHESLLTSACETYEEFPRLRSLKGYNQHTHQKGGSGNKSLIPKCGKNNVLSSKCHICNLEVICHFFRENISLCGSIIGFYQEKPMKGSAVQSCAEINKVKVV